jgi:hypothetical protein
MRRSCQQKAKDDWRRRSGDHVATGVRYRDFRYGRYTHPSLLFPPGEATTGRSLSATDAKQPRGMQLTQLAQGSIS